MRWCRGVVGGVVAALFTHSGPEFGHRILVWMAVAWVWGPLVSYVGGQRQHRSQLLEELARAEKRREIARQPAERSTEEVRDQKLDVMRKVVRPAWRSPEPSLLMADPPPSVDEMR
jgi:heme exporter protein D